MSKIIENSTQDGQKLLLNTKYIIRVLNDQKYGAFLTYDNGGEKEELKTEMNYEELKKLIQD